VVHIGLLAVAEVHQVDLDLALQKAVLVVQAVADMAPVHTNHTVVKVCQKQAVAVEAHQNHNKLVMVVQALLLLDTQHKEK
jgi:hypothetical protein